MKIKKDWSAFQIKKTNFSIDFVFEYLQNEKNKNRWKRADENKRETHVKVNDKRIEAIEALNQQWKKMLATMNTL